MNLIKKQINVKPRISPSTRSSDYMDWVNLLISLICNEGWHKVNLYKVDRSEVESWCKEHICGEYKSRDSTWVFKEEKDYIMFLLRWS
jgi:hypothetical protein